MLSLKLSTPPKIQRILFQIQMCLYRQKAEFCFSVIHFGLNSMPLKIIEKLQYFGYLLKLTLMAYARSGFYNALYGLEPLIRLILCTCQFFFLPSSVS